MIKNFLKRLALAATDVLSLVVVVGAMVVTLYLILRSSR